MKRIPIAAFIVIAVWLALSACASQALVISDSMQPEDYFQLAQERAEKKDYAAAIAYYYKCKEKFPDNLEKNTWASYEIAFLYHKMRDDAKALVLLDELLSLYKQDKSRVLPQAPKLLAEQVRENIINKGKNDLHTEPAKAVPPAQ